MKDLKLWRKLCCYDWFEFKYNIKLYRTREKSETFEKRSINLVEDYAKNNVAEKVVRIICPIQDT